MEKRTENVTDPASVSGEKPGCEEYDHSALETEQTAAEFRLVRFESDGAGKCLVAGNRFKIGRVPNP